MPSMTVSGLATAHQHANPLLPSCCPTPTTATTAAPLGGGGSITHVAFVQQPLQQQQQQQYLFQSLYPCGSCGSSNPFLVFPTHNNRGVFMTHPVVNGLQSFLIVQQQQQQQQHPPLAAPTQMRIPPQQQQQQVVFIPPGTQFTNGCQRQEEYPTTTTVGYDIQGASPVSGEQERGKKSHA